MEHQYNQEKLNKKIEIEKNKLIKKLTMMTSQEREIYISELANRLKRLQLKIKDEKAKLDSINYKPGKKLKTYQITLLLLSGILTGAGLGYLVGQLDPEYLAICTGMGGLLGFGIGSFPYVEIEDREIANCIVDSRRKAKSRQISRLQTKEAETKELLKEAQNEF